MTVRGERGASWFSKNLSSEEGKHMAPLDSGRQLVWVTDGRRTNENGVVEASPSLTHTHTPFEFSPNLLMSLGFFGLIEAPKRDVTRSRSSFCRFYSLGCRGERGRRMFWGGNADICPNTESEGREREKESPAGLRSWLLRGTCWKHCLFQCVVTSTRKQHAASSSHPRPVTPR